MNNDELDHLLKSASLAPRPGGYWLAFPKKVSAALPRQPDTTATPRPSLPPRFALPGLAIIGLGIACVAAGFFLDFWKHRQRAGSNAQLGEARKCFAEIEALFPNQLRAIVFDRDGTHLLLADKADVPQADPLYLKVCAASGCENVVTFSGQQIPFNGQNCEVLAQANGQVILVGDRLVWPNNDGADHVTIAAQLLNRSPSL